MLRLFTTNHKPLALLFLLLSLLAFAFAGLLAMVIRWQLAWPGDPHHPVPILAWLMHWPAGIMPPEFYNGILSMHATIMVWFVVIPLLNSAFGNYLVPLQIGARNMAFPRLTGISFWLTLVSFVILVTGFWLAGGPAQAGWTSYAPLSSIPFNGGGWIDAPRGVLSMLQPTHSTWPTIPVLLNFASLLLLGGYLLSQRPTRTSGIANHGDTEIRREGGAGNSSPSLRASVVDSPAPTQTMASLPLTIVLAVIFAVLAVRAEQAVAFDGQSCWFLSLIVLGIANIVGGVNLITTVATMRCRGMTMFRLPLTVWNLLASAALTLAATPALVAVLLMSLLDHHQITHFFSATGVVMLFPQLFWFYSHPAVYIMMLPAMGIVSDILPVFARKPLFGYHAMVWASLLIAVLGFLVWGHHLFQSGMNPMLGTTFAVSSLVIATPSGIKTFNWLATLWHGKITMSVPLLNCIAFISLFVIGGLSGIVLASSAIDVQLHMTWFVVAHLHYVLFGGSMFGIFAGIYFWYPKMFGRMMSPTLGYVHTIVSYLAFHATFFPMHFLGLAGLPRRIADDRAYHMFAHLQTLQIGITHGAFLLGAAQLVLVINFVGSLIWGAKAADNPWNATTLEWSTSSPPPAGNFDRPPVVRHGPYQFCECTAGIGDFVPQVQA